jgi:hypothetical protein
MAVALSDEARKQALSGLKRFWAENLEAGGMPRAGALVLAQVGLRASEVAGL